MRKTLLTLLWKLPLCPRRKLVIDVLHWNHSAASNACFGSPSQNTKHKNRWPNTVQLEIRLTHALRRLRFNFNSNQQRYSSLGHPVSCCTHTIHSILLLYYTSIYLLLIICNHNSHSKWLACSPHSIDSSILRSTRPKPFLNVVSSLGNIAPLHLSH